MTIKQQGGIFGRKPTFSSINADDISVDNDIIFGGEASNKSGLSSSGTFNAATPTSTYAYKVYSSDGVTNLGGLYNSNNGVALFLKDDEGNTKATLSGYGDSSFDFNIVFSSGKGIDFSATAGTGTSELLDDYEEGTWTPIITAETVGDLSVTYTRQVGVYTKVGRLVTASFRITTSAFSHSTAANEIYVAGLPFTSRNVTDMKTIGAGYVYGANKTGFTQLNGALDPAVDRMEFVATGPAGSSISSLKITEVPSGGTPFLGGTITYEV